MEKGKTAVRYMITLVFLMLTSGLVPATLADDDPDAWRREAQKEYAPLSVNLALGNLSLSEQQFQDAARRAYSRRHWKVLEAKSSVVTAELARKGAVYRVDMEMKGANVEIRYHAGYSDKRTNYLDNLRRDLAFELRIND